MNSINEKTSLLLNPILIGITFILILLAILTITIIDLPLLPISSLVFFLAGVLLCWGYLIYREIDLYTDPRLLCFFFAFFYLVVAPLSRRISYDLFSNDVYSLSYIYVILGVIGLLISTFFWKPISLDEIKKSQVFGLNERIFQIVGISFALLGYVFFFFNYGRIGGLLSALKISKVDRMAQLSSKMGNIPFSVFIITGAVTFLYCIFFGKKNKTFKIRNNLGRFIILAVMILPLCIFWLFEGERSGLMKIFLPLLAVYIYRFPHRQSKRLRFS